MIGLLRRTMQALLGRGSEPSGPLGHAERLDAAHRRLKDTIPAPED